MARDEDRGHLAVSDGSGFDFAGAFLDLAASIGSVKQQVAAANAPVPWEAVHPVWFTGSIPITSGSGTLQQSDLYGPKNPYWWDLRSIRAWGFTAGTVTVLRNDPNVGEELAVFSTVGEYTWSSQEFLSPQDQMIFEASSITGTVTLAGWAVEIETAWLPAYLM